MSGIHGSQRHSTDLVGRAETGLGELPKLRTRVRFPSPRRTETKRAKCCTRSVAIRASPRRVEADGCSPHRGGQAACPDGGHSPAPCPQCDLGIYEPVVSTEAVAEVERNLVGDLATYLWTLASDDVDEVISTLVAKRTKQPVTAHDLIEAMRGSFPRRAAAWLAGGT